VTYVDRFFEKHNDLRIDGSVFSAGEYGDGAVQLIGEPQ
jgi:hypothetical protein